jgi:hypothetical protein
MRRFVGISALPAERNALNAWRVARTVSRTVAGSAAFGYIDVGAVEGEGDRHDKRGVPLQPASDVGTDHRRKAGAIENALQFPDP